MLHLLDPKNYDTVRQWLKDRGYPAFRFAQIRKWLFEGRVKSLEEMTDLPKKLREEMSTEFQIWTSTIAKHEKSQDGTGTEKLLLQLADGGRIECVLLRDGERRSICISSQVGCAMGCVFCASGLDGVDRNLTTGEIVEQMLVLSRLLPAEERLSHIVVMGMGEPLANIDNLLIALGEASSENGLAISPRRITISTVGLPPAMDKLSRLECKYHLAVSLHAPNDALRNKIVPVNKNIGIDKILEAADRYFEASGRRLTFEYVLLANLNDSEEHAEELVDILQGRTVMLNVIPYNPVAGLPYATPTANRINRFRDVLMAGGINVKFRQRRGSDINAACGQLRRKAAGEPGPALSQISPSGSSL